MAGASPVNTPGPVLLYSSLVPPGVYAQRLTAPQISEFGAAVNLAPNPAGAMLGTVTVGMVNYGAPIVVNVQLELYAIGTGGVLGRPLLFSAIDVTAPSCATAPADCVDGRAMFEATFDVATGRVVLPGTIVYGLSFYDLAAAGSLGIELAPNVSTGSNVYRGVIFQPVPVGSALPNGCPARAALKSAGARVVGSPSTTASDSAPVTSRTTTKVGSSSAPTRTRPLALGFPPDTKG
jgi:hypothetical protein